MQADMWVTLPCDLLVEIFRRLETTAVIRCAGTCRPWRRAIIDNASCLRPHPDRFLPNLLVGFLDTYWSIGQDILVRLQYVPASSTNTTVPAFFTPADGGFSISVDGRLYNSLLLLREGFVLLRGDMDANLCLGNPLTGVCMVLPAAALDDPTGACMYVLVTGYDVDDDYSAPDNDGDETAVWIIAVDTLRDAKDGMNYQIFSSTSGAWGPTKRSGNFPEGQANVYIRHSDVVICRGVVYWFLRLIPKDPNKIPRTSMFAMDLRTERTWMMTDLPLLVSEHKSLILALSEDGRLSVVKMLSPSYEMEVWVLVDGQWTLRRTMDMQKLLQICPSMDQDKMWLTGFCPRSGCLFGTGRDDMDVEHHFLIGIEGVSPRLIGRVNFYTARRRPYEMDLSTYISKMKYF